MDTTDVKHYYDEHVRSSRDGYEYRRWFSTPTRKVGYEMTKHAIERLVLPRLTSDMHVAELGPGAGTWTKLLLAAHPTLSVDLIDISSEMLAQAKRALPTDADIRLHETDFMEFVPECSYDFFFSSRALEYFPDKDGAIQRIAALLRPGGWGLILTKYPHYKRRALQGEIVPDFHAGQIEPDTLCALLEKHSLRVDTTQLVTFVFPKLQSALLDKCLFALFGDTGVYHPAKVMAESYAVLFQKL